MNTKLYLVLLSSLLLQLLFLPEASAQKWKKNKPNTLYAVNKKKRTDPVFVGIGLKTPTAQFHTTGSVRLQGLQASDTLNRFVGIDKEGNLFWRDLSALLNNPAAWLLTGNTATVSDFIGTKNNEDFRIRTSNSQRMVIDKTGHVGINNATPSGYLDVAGYTVIRPGAGGSLPGQPGLAILQNSNIMNHGGYIAFHNQVTKKSFDIIQGGRCGASGDDLNFIYYPNRDISCTDGQYTMTLQQNRVGIGAISPTANLHVNGSVRMEALQNNNTMDRILVADVNGNLAYRNASTLTGSGAGSGGGWGLTGNAAGSTDFIGTTTFEDFRIKTNNIQRVVVDKTGHVGINNPTPSGYLDVAGYAVIRPGASGSFPAQPGLVFLQNTSIMNHGAYIAFHNVGTGKSYDIIQGGLCGASGDDLNFIYYPNRDNSCNNGQFVLSMQQNKVGINTNTPTAAFHTRGTVRMENLPAGAGNVLVADANGNVYRSSAVQGRYSDADVETLKTELEQLKQEFAAMKAMLAVKSPAGTMKGAELMQNNPNPFSDNTTIRYILPAGVNQAVLQITDNSGTVVKTYPLHAKSRQLTIEAGSMAAGVYYYSLIADNQVVETRKMILTK